MKLMRLIPMLRTNQLKESLDFYVNTLEFTCNHFSEDWGWASLSKDEVEIMLALPNEHEPFDEACLTGSIYLRTGQVEEWWIRLKDKARICYPLESFEYGMREFAIYDNNGYLLLFGQELPG